MKKLLTIVLALTLCVMSVNAQNDEEQKKTTKDSDRMGQNICRGVVNMLTCWVEVPRCFWIETIRNPYYGSVVGLMSGSFLTVGRAFGGVSDVVTLGLTGPGIYGEGFPEFVWQSRWTATDALIKQQEAQEKAVEQTKASQPEPAK